MTAPIQGIDYVDLDRLRLDPENPRLPKRVERTEEAMLDYIGRHFSIVELMIAIGVNDYFAGEPLLVSPCESNNDNFVVVEGNRRLTAVKLLSTPELVKKRSVAAAAKGAIHRPLQLPVVIFESRTEILAYLGNRHIAGVKAWSSLSKARYLRELYDNFDDETNEDDKYYQLAKQIGSRRDYVKRALIALGVYEKIEENNFFNFDGVDETTIQFSVFYSALSRADYRDFISLKDNLASVNEINIDALREMTEYICVKHGRSTVLKNPQNLSRLGEVISTTKALSVLRETKNLHLAHSLTSNFHSIITDLVHQANDAIALAIDAMNNAVHPDTESEKDEVTHAVAKVKEQAGILSEKWNEKNVTGAQG